MMNKLGILAFAAQADVRGAQRHVVKIAVVPRGLVAVYIEIPLE